MPDPSVEALRRSPLFAELGNKTLRKIAAGMSERSFPAGTVVAKENEVGVGFFIVEDGEARVDVGGREVRRLGPGDHFGEIALIVEAPRTATVTAETDLECYAITSWEFRKLVEGNLAVAWKLLEGMTRLLLERERQR